VSTFVSIRRKFEDHKNKGVPCPLLTTVPPRVRHEPRYSGIFYGPLVEVQKISFSGRPAAEGGIGVCGGGKEGMERPGKGPILYGEIKEGGERGGRRGKHGGSPSGREGVRREKGEGRREKGEGRREKGEGRREKGEGRSQTG
jgi:hypothetical protein